MELRECPFCGGQAILLRRGTRRVSCRVACEDCGCHLETNEEGPLSGHAWNHRVRPPAVAAMLEQEFDGYCD